METYANNWNPKNGFKSREPPDALAKGMTYLPSNRKSICAASKRATCSSETSYIINCPSIATEYCAKVRMSSRELEYPLKVQCCKHNAWILPLNLPPLYRPGTPASTTITTSCRVHYPNKHGRLKRSHQSYSPQAYGSFLVLRR